MSHLNAHINFDHYRKLARLALRKRSITGVQNNVNYAYALIDPSERPVTNRWVAMALGRLLPAALQKRCVLGAHELACWPSIMTSHDTDCSKPLQMRGHVSERRSKRLK